CTVAHSLEEALALFGPEEDVFVIGGAQIYAEAMPLADKFYLTVVEQPFAGDTSFPQWDSVEWELVETERFERSEERPLGFRFETYLRKK
ncbi:MAG: dihydrofolate reductase, partial [Alistipes sp.]|nr:dihydrofolate reductase [Alistipes sp.]